jgi:hypothetical protein
MERLTGPLAGALQRGRQTFNAKFAAAAKAAHPIDPAEFQDHLRTAVDPIVRGVAAESADRVDLVTDALYDVSLDLFAHGLLGAKAQFPAIPAAWRELLPSLAHLVAREPERVTGAVTNALYNMSRTPGARPLEWLQALKALRCQTVVDLLDCGAVLSWRCGMTLYREGALQKARSLAPDMAGRALGLGLQADVPRVIEKLVSSPWVRPEDCLSDSPKELRIVARAGGFRGFAGHFLSPPKVVKMDGALVATDGVTAWQVHADIYNAVLVRCDLPAKTDPATDAAIQPTGTLSWQGRTHRFPELASATAIAATDDTVAVTIATSHHVFLVAHA